MITSISAKNFKGLEFTTPLERLVLMIGPNGAGKSARSDALQLALLGCHPAIDKKNSDIYETFGDGVNPVFVGCQLADKTHLLRRFAKEKDTVSQTYMVDRRKATKEEFAVAAAGVKIFDLHSFMSLSDQKKLDLIYNLFPPAGDLKDLNGKIEDLKEKQNQQTAKIRALTMTKERLNTARAALQLPAGTQAETTAQIEVIEKQLVEARADLEAARTANAVEEAEEKARAEAERQATIEAEKASIEAEKRVAEALQGEKDKIREEVRGGLGLPSMAALVDDQVPIPSVSVTYTAGGQEHKELHELPGADRPFLSPFKREVVPLTKEGQMIADIFDAPFIESFKTILATMERTGCTACAAMLVCKRELRKFQKGAAA
jgi:hypothetical protein